MEVQNPKSVRPQDDPRSKTGEATAGVPTADEQKTSDKPQSFGAAGAPPPGSNLEKKFRRAERFGMPVQLSEEEKRSTRAQRFGTGSTSIPGNDSGKLEEQKRKARAERFGLAEQTPVDDEAKKKARLARFSQNSKSDGSEEAKMKARAARFSQAPSTSSEVNGKAKSDLAGGGGGS